MGKSTGMEWRWEKFMVMGTVYFTMSLSSRLSRETRGMWSTTGWRHLQVECWQIRSVPSAKIYQLFNYWSVIHYIFLSLLQHVKQWLVGLLRHFSTNRLCHPMDVWNIHNTCIVYGQGQTHKHWKKRSERRKHCALAVVRRSQKFSPCRRPPSRGCRTAKI